MRVTSNYYDYYYSQSYAANSILNSNAQLNTQNTDNSEDETDSISFQARRYSAAGGYDNLMNMNYSGVMMKHSLQMQGMDSSEISENMEKFKTDMDSLKSADIDNMSADEVKETLATLKADMEAMPKPQGTSNELTEIDLDSMSESQMREMLSNIQEHSKNAPEMGKGKPPMKGQGMPPMMGGVDLTQMLGDTSETEESDETDFSQYSEAYMQQIVNNLISSYDSSSTTSDEYVAKVKESLSSIFNKQKSNIDNLSSMIFSKLDEWSTEEEI